MENTTCFMMELTKVFVIQPAYVIRILKKLVWTMKFKVLRKKDKLCTWTKPEVLQ